jgi:hypothetical protein
MPTPAPLTVPLQQDLEAACAAFLESTRTGGGYVVDSFTVEMETGLTVRRDEGGLAGLFRTEGTTRESGSRIAWTCKLDFDLYERLARADADAKSGDLTPADIRAAQEYITVLARGWKAQKQPPAVGTEWDGAWASALGEALRAAGHPVLGARVLTQRTLGWLEAVAARVE